MFDIGFFELLIIAVLGLVVLGPERLPGAIRFDYENCAQYQGHGQRLSSRSRATVQSS